MASAPLNWLLKIGGEALSTVSQTLSGAVNELKQDLSSAVTTLTGRFSSINNLDDVNITTPTDGQIFGYDGTNEEWKNVDGNFMKTDGSNASNEVVFPNAFTLGSRLSNSVVGAKSVAEGTDVTASGANSHAEGIDVTASGQRSHAEGRYTEASGYDAHAEGSGYSDTYRNVASGLAAHVEGWSTGMDQSGYNLQKHSSATGQGAHAEGINTKASNDSAHAEGTSTQATERGAHAEGQYTLSSSLNTHAEGYRTEASGEAAHSEGYSENNDYGLCGIKASGQGSHAEGCNEYYNGHILASGNGAHAEGCTSSDYGSTEASGKGSHAEGISTKAEGLGSHAQGGGTTAHGQFSHASGVSTTAFQECSFAHGNMSDERRKFYNTAMPNNGYFCTGFSMNAAEHDTDANIYNIAQTGYSGCVENTATVTLNLDVNAMYLLIDSAYTVSSGAFYASAVYLITTAGSTGTPNNTLIKASGTNQPATIAAVANNKITIKNGAATRATQFTLIRVA